MTSMNRREFLGAAARLGFLAGVAGDPTRLYAADERRTIRGRVMGVDRPLGSVLVSDGRRVVRTDPGGDYELLIGPESV